MNIIKIDYGRPDVSVYDNNVDCNQIPHLKPYDSANITCRNPINLNIPIVEVHIVLEIKQVSIFHTEFIEKYGFQIKKDNDGQYKYLRENLE